MALIARRAVAHDARLTLTEHLDELRSRLIICALALVVAFAFTFWQNEAVLNFVNEPLEQTQNLDGKERSNDPLEQTARFQILQGRALEAQRKLDEALAASDELPADVRALARAAARASAVAVEAVPSNRERQPVTLGVAEPFTTTWTVAFYAALLLTLPVLLFQLYAFVLPAFAPGERRVALPLMLMVPFLFVAGCAFGYWVVLPRAIGFLQNFNDDDFDILIQAKEYYKFAVLFIGSIGLLFQIPIAVLAVTRLGILTPRQLQQNSGYVLLGLAVLAAVATPTPDPLTMLLALAPLFLLFQLSILLAAWLNRVSPPGSLWGEEFDELAPVPDDDKD